MTKRELFEHSLAELQSQVERHQQVMRSALAGEAVESHCLWSDCKHERALVDVIVESVQVLDETRKAFKSKQLEQLRSRLMRVLADYANTPCAGLKRSSRA